jgi:hypothetical protein
VILDLYFLEVGLQIGFGGFNSQVIAGDALKTVLSQAAAAGRSGPFGPTARARHRPSSSLSPPASSSRAACDCPRSPSGLWRLAARPRSHGQASPPLQLAAAAPSSAHSALRPCVLLSCSRVQPRPRWWSRGDLLRPRAGGAPDHPEHGYKAQS